MEFITADYSHYYQARVLNNLDVDDYSRWLDKIKEIGFTHVQVEEVVLPIVYDLIMSRELKILFTPSCISSIEKIDDNNYKNIPWHDDRYPMDDTSEDLYFYRFQKILRNVKEYCIDIFSIQNATHYEWCFPIKNANAVLEGDFLYFHDRTISFFEKLLNLYLEELGGHKFLVPIMSVGFGANSHVRHEVDSYAISQIAKDRHVDLYLNCPSEGIHSSRYLQTMILHQKSLQRHLGARIGLGAMGLFGFPTTASCACLNGYDFIHMFTNEKELTKYKRLTRIGYEDVVEARLDLMKNVIKFINADDKDALRDIVRVYSKECYNNSSFPYNITDDHWGLDNLRSARDPFYRSEKEK